MPNLQNWAHAKLSMNKVNNMRSWNMQIFWLVLNYDLLKDRWRDDIIIINFCLFFIKKKQIDSMSPWVCQVKDHKSHQQVVRTSLTHLGALCVPFTFSHHIWHHLWSITVHLVQGAVVLIFSSFLCLFSHQFNV